LIAFDLNTPPDTLKAYLAGKGILPADESLTGISKAGEGNMNVVLRLHTDRRSLILKQSRPFVQKYPDIPAPLERIQVEKRFYELLLNTQVAEHFPSVIGYDPDQYLLLLQDLGQARDMSYLYESRQIETGAFQALIKVLATIHRSSPQAPYPQNLELRKLNHQHIFVLPFQENNGFPLDELQPGLAELALPFKTDPVLKAKIERLGDQYLSPGGVLLHGDYYPGSWLEHQGKTYVIDPEFSFMGFAEFDVGVMTAHLIMATMDPLWLPRCLDAYPLSCDTNMVGLVAGTEILRRLIGLAQLPLKRSLDEKAFLMQQARILLENEA
jgi:5-methylthioribose kinase